MFPGHAAGSATDEPQRTLTESARRTQIAAAAIDNIAEAGQAYMRPRVLAETAGPGMLADYIESNLAFMRDHRNNVIAVMEIARSAQGRLTYYGDTDVINAVDALEHALSGFQTAGQFRPDVEPHVMAIAIRAPIEAASPRLAQDPEFDIDNYSHEIITIFDLATRVEGGP